MRARRILIMEAEVESAETASKELAAKLDAFLEAAQPSAEHGITITVAAREDLEAFAAAGCLLPNTSILTGDAPDLSALAEELGQKVREVHDRHGEDQDLQFAFDDAIYDLAGGSRASDINNRGFEGQIEYILEQEGTEEGTKRVESILADYVAEHECRNCHVPLGDQSICPDCGLDNSRP